MRYQIINHKRTFQLAKCIWSINEHEYNKITSDKIELQTFPAWYVDIIPAYQMGFKIRPLGCHSSSIFIH